VQTGRWIGRVALAAALAPLLGCAHGPRSFKKVDSPAPLVRARAVGLGRRQADEKVIPALVNRLQDADPVVRLAAHEELRGRTGRDFGYVPWASPEERAVAVNRWRDWMVRGDGVPQSASSALPPPPVAKVLPAATAQAQSP
jgi:HEAT repeat protein